MRRAWVAEAVLDASAPAVPHDVEARERGCGSCCRPAVRAPTPSCGPSRPCARARGRRRAPSPRGESAQVSAGVRHVSLVRGASCLRRAGPEQARARAWMSRAGSAPAAGSRAGWAQESPTTPKARRVSKVAGRPRASISPCDGRVLEQAPRDADQASARHSPGSDPHHEQQTARPSNRLCEGTNLPQTGQNRRLAREGFSARTSSRCSRSIRDRTTRSSPSSTSSTSPCGETIIEWPV